MSDSFHRFRQCFLVHNASCIEFHFQPEPFQQNVFQDLHLHLPHDLHVDLSVFLLPQHMQLWFFLFQLSDLAQCCHRIRLRRQQQAVCQDRFQNRCGIFAFKSQSLSCKSLCQTGNCTDFSCFHNVRGLIITTVVQTQLIRFFLPVLFSGSALIVSDHHLDPQASAGNLQIRQTVP